MITRVGERKEVTQQTWKLRVQIPQIFTANIELVFWVHKYIGTEVTDDATQRF